MGARAVNLGRTTADVDSDVIVFLIGMRINSLWMVHRWLRVMLAMAKMLRQLATHPDKGLLSAQTFLSGRTIMVVQHWTTFEALEHFARSADDPHLSAWREYNKAARKGGRHVGVFHETYRVPADSYENIYVDMPVTSLSRAYGAIPVSRRGQSAGYRIGSRPIDDVAVPVPVPSAPSDAAESH